MHLVAVAAGVAWSVRYAGTLDLRRHELRRYFEKSIGLALCYAGIARPHDVKGPWRAGKAAFFCCAYDVVTDWRSFSIVALIQFQRLLASSRISNNLAKLALDLYYKEKDEILENDGLCRGSIALRFIVEMIGNRSLRFENIDEVGELLQIVDDVLDYEDDLATGDTNCLTGVRRQAHLLRLLNGLNESETRRMFGASAFVLSKVINKGREKALRMLGSEAISPASDQIPIPSPHERKRPFLKVA